MNSLMRPAPASTSELELIANCAATINQGFQKALWACLLEEMAVSDQLTIKCLLQQRSAQISKQYTSSLSIGRFNIQHHCSGCLKLLSVGLMEEHSVHLTSHDSVYSII